MICPAGGATRRRMQRSGSPRCCVTPPSTAWSCSDRVSSSIPRVRYCALPRRGLRKPAGPGSGCSEKPIPRAGGFAGCVPHREALGVPAAVSGLSVQQMTDSAAPRVPAARYGAGARLSARGDRGTGAARCRLGRAVDPLQGSLHGVRERGVAHGGVHRNRGDSGQLRRAPASISGSRRAPGRGAPGVEDTSGTGQPVRSPRVRLCQRRGSSCRSRVRRP